MEAKSEEKTDTQEKKDETVTTPVLPTQQSQPQIEDPKSLITKIDNRFKTKVDIFFTLHRTLPTQKVKASMTINSKWNS